MSRMRRRGSARGGRTMIGVPSRRATPSGGGLAAVGTALVAVLNVTVAGGRMSSPAVSPHQARTDALYLGLAGFGLLAALLALAKADRRPRGRSWWVVAVAAIGGLAAGLLALDRWSGGSYVHHDHGLPLPWIQGVALAEGYPPGMTGPIRWRWAGHGFLADLLLWTSIGHGLAAVLGGRPVQRGGAP